MGIPYSREINSAFDQVTPLVAAGFKVLKTTKNISILLAVVQIWTAVLLGLILLALLGLLFTMNPELEEERTRLVTPVMQWLGSWVFEYGTLTLWMIRVMIVLSTAALGLFLWDGAVAENYFSKRDEELAEEGVEEAKEA